MNQEQIKTGRLIQSGRSLYQVSTVYDIYFTAQLVYPLPTRTSVYSFYLSQADEFKSPSDYLIRKFDQAYGRAV